MPKYKGLNKEICRKCLEHDFYSQSNKEDISTDLKELKELINIVSLTSDTNILIDLTHKIRRKACDLNYFADKLTYFNSDWNQSKSVKCPLYNFSISIEGKPPEQCPYTLEHFIL